MGSNLAYELANGDFDLSTALKIHLTSNHYPPVPESMVMPCIEALEAYWDHDIDRQIAMPEGVSYLGLNWAPAYAIIEQHHLEAWLYDDED